MRRLFPLTPTPLPQGERGFSFPSPLAGEGGARRRWEGEGFAAALLTLFLTTPAFAATPSLLFFDSEVTAIEAARESALTGAPDPSASSAAGPGEAAAQPARPRIPNVYVSAIMDLGDGHWTVWANGYRITPGRQPRQFNVLSVSADAVEIAVLGDDPARIRLHPNQTWRSRQRDIVEGIVP